LRKKLRSAEIGVRASVLCVSSGLCRSSETINRAQKL
jgi:hypothetical protein